MPELRDELTRAGASEHEAAELAALLVRAAEPARFEVPADQVERMLARVRPARRPRQLPRVAFAMAALALVVLALVLLLPSRQQSVQARALAAFGGDDTVLHLRESLFTRVVGVAESDRDVWVDPSRGATATRCSGRTSRWCARRSPVATRTGSFSRCRAGSTRSCSSTPRHICRG